MFPARKICDLTLVKKILKNQGCIPGAKNIGGKKINRQRNFNDNKNAIKIVKS